MALRDRRWAMVLWCVGGMGLVAAVTLAVATTRWGLGVSPDSVTYLRMARSFLGHESGLPPHFSRFPPLYPALLGGLSALSGLDPFRAARWLNAVLFGANVALVGLITLRLTGSGLFGAIAAAFVAASYEIWLVHSHLWTEPLFLLLALLALYLLGSESPEGSGWRYWTGAVCLSLACLTRYAGIAVILAAALGLWLSGAERLGRRLLRVLMMVLIAAFPMLVWGAQGSGFAGRSVGWHPISASEISRALKNVGKWLLPEPFAAPETGAVFVVLGAGVLAWILAAEKALSATLGDPGRYRILGMLAALLLIYPMFLIASISLYDAASDMGARLLGAPLFPVAAVAFTTLAAALLRGRSSALRAAAMVCCLLLVVMYLRRTGAYGLAIWREGQGYSGRSWRESPSIEFARRLPPGLRLYTNRVPPVWFLAGRPADPVPNKYEPATLRRSATFERRCAELAESFESGQAVLIWFRTEQRWYLPAEHELVQRLHVQPVVEFPDGVVYGRSGDRAGLKHLVLSTRGE